MFRSFTEKNFNSVKCNNQIQCYFWRLYEKKSREGVRSPSGPLQNIFLFSVIYSLLFHVDVFTFQTYVGHEIRRCELISLKSFKFQARGENETQKYRHNLKEAHWNDKPSLRWKTLE